MPTPTIGSATVAFGGWYSSASLSGSAVTSASSGTYYAKWTFNAVSANSSNLWYSYANTSADVRGYSGGSRIKTTYNNLGFVSSYLVGAAPIPTGQNNTAYAGTTIIYSKTTGTDIFASTSDGIYVARIMSFEGKYAKVTYLVQNRGTNAVNNYNLAVYSDVMIAENDRAPITYTTAGNYKYFSMSDATSGKTFRLYTKGGSATEAFVGWYHPKIGMIDQHELMTIAEKTGLIAPIELWAIWSVCKQNKAWIDAGYQISPITVKFSSYQFEDARLVSSIKDVLLGTGLSPEYLVISITESLLVRESVQAADTLKQLEQLGVRIVIDSMGITGSSLTYLKRLSVDEIRTDMRSIGGIPKDKQSGKTVIALKKNIREGKLAEAAESKLQLDFSEDGDGYTIQEYYFRPITANDIEKLYGMPDDDFAASNISGKD